MGVRQGLWTTAFVQNGSDWGRSISCLGVIHELNGSPSNMSGQAADSVNLKVNTMFDLQANLTDQEFKKLFEVNRLT